MGRAARISRLTVYLQDNEVGTLAKESSGAISFNYAGDWLTKPGSSPISLSLPLQSSTFRGDAVTNVFESLLPDSMDLRRQVAERIDARGTDAYSLLSVIGRDCVGALQFLPDGTEPPSTVAPPDGRELDESEVEDLLKNLARSPLGLEPDDAFRISVAGMQEKTALLRRDDKWFKPHGTTPTTHIFKPAVGMLPGGINLTDSVENEYFCLKLVKAFELPVTHAWMETFGETKTLVVERFDRKWTEDGRLTRLPQEDCCQALSIPPTLKYQSDSGPSILKIMELLRGSDRPTQDRERFLKAQILFWLIGTPDGHGKNFSIRLGTGGRFRLAPLYDILSAEPSLALGQIQKKHMRLAMSVGDNNKYKLDDIFPRHFLQTAKRAHFSERRVRNLFDTIADTALAALDATTDALPDDFPGAIPDAMRAAVSTRRDRLVGHSTD